MDLMDMLGDLRQASKYNMSYPSAKSTSALDKMLQDTETNGSLLDLTTLPEDQRECPICLECYHTEEKAFTTDLLGELPFSGNEDTRLLPDVPFRVPCGHVWHAPHHVHAAL